VILKSFASVLYAVNISQQSEAQIVSVELYVRGNMTIKIQKFVKRDIDQNTK